MVRWLFKPSASLSRRELSVWGILWIGSGVGLWLAYWLTEAAVNSSAPAWAWALILGAVVGAPYVAIATVVYGATLIGWLFRGIGLIDPPTLGDLARAYQGPLRLATLAGILPILFVSLAAPMAWSHYPTDLAIFFEIGTAVLVAIWSVINGLRCCSRHRMSTLPSSMLMASSMLLAVAAFPIAQWVFSLKDLVWEHLGH